jgi:hypothetical protein
MIYVNPEVPRCGNKRVTVIKQICDFYYTANSMLSGIQAEGILVQLAKI